LRSTGMGTDRQMVCIILGPSIQVCRILNTNVKLLTQVSNINAQPTSRVMGTHSPQDETSVSAPEPSLVATKVGEMRIRTSEPENDMSMPAEMFRIWVVRTVEQQKPREIVEQIERP
jgi:hypothetical protein